VFQIDRILAGQHRELRCGDYALLDHLGQGGMGRVFKARHRYTRRLDALKLLSPNLTGTPAIVERFFREVANLSRLHHEGIVRAYTAGTEGNIPYFAMELVNGETLSQRLRTRTLSIEEVLDYLRQAAEALRYAWEEHHVIHRDVKPANLMVSGGRVKLLDFGLGRTLGPEVEKTLTEPGVPLGSLDYIAPEQGTDAHSVDHRADIYALGCTAFHLLTNQVPFPDTGSQDKLNAHRRREPPSLRDLRDDVPEHLEALLGRMMAKRPEDRPQTYGQLLDSLAACR
jgi:serine/threonine-protein kinase